MRRGDLTPGDIARQIALWMAFTVALSLLWIIHSCNNIVPLKMMDKGYCWDPVYDKYRRCEPPR